jgi:dihydroorotase
MALLLKNARLVDPAVSLDAPRDILIRDGKIVEIGEPGTVDLPKGVERDLAGKIVVPGLVDMHVHLRDPGQEYKEDIASGGRAAAKGGFTAVLAMPNTKPTCDNSSIVRDMLEKAERSTRTRIHVSGALTVGLKGEALSEMGDMARAGAVAFTDDGRGVQGSNMMRLAMDYAKTFGRPVLSHCQVEDLSAKGAINEGAVSTRLGLTGWPAAAEEIQIARDIALAELTGCPLHIQHISTAKGAELVAQAKAAGLPVTCEVTPHHLFLSEEDINESYNTSFKMNPPLRTREDTLALQQHLISGVIDCVATDHAPHALFEKALEFELAPFGTTGLETALPLMITEMVDTGALSWDLLVERMAHAPRRILGLEAVRLEVGSTADLTVIDPTATYEVTADSFESKAQNSAFIGRTLKGRASDVYVAGYATLEEGEVVNL